MWRAFLHLSLTREVRHALSEVEGSASILRKQMARRVRVVPLNSNSNDYSL